MEKKLVHKLRENEDLIFLFWLSMHSQNLTVTILYFNNFLIFNITKKKGTITEMLKFKMQIQHIISSIERLFQ